MHDETMTTADRLAAWRDTIRAAELAELPAAAALGPSARAEIRAEVSAEVRAVVEQASRAAQRAAERAKQASHQAAEDAHAYHRTQADAHDAQRRAGS